MCFIQTNCRGTSFVSLKLKMEICTLDLDFGLPISINSRAIFPPDLTVFHV